MGIKLQPYQEFKNILSQREIDDIYNTLTDNMFPWYFSATGMTVLHDTYQEDSDENTKEYLQFVHQFYDINGMNNSDYAHMADHILERFLDHVGIKIRDRFRIKANLQTKANFLPTQYNCPHYDRPFPHWVLLYYPHNSDGDTVIFSRKFGDEKTTYKKIASITPEAGKFLLFDGAYYHTGCHPRQHDTRLVINFNIEIDD